MAEHHGKTVPVHARADQAVLIHWRLADGSTFTETRTCPPLATIAASIDKKQS